MAGKSSGPGAASPIISVGSFIWNKFMGKNKTNALP
jgi:hypothetical protein